MSQTSRATSGIILRKVGFAFAVVVLFVLIGPTILSLILVNSSMVALHRALRSEDAMPMSFDVSADLLIGVLPSNRGGLTALRLAQAAERVDTSPRSLWALGRIACAVGAYDIASEAFRQLRSKPFEDADLDSYALVSYSFGTDAEEVLRIYDEAPSLADSDYITDAVALAHIKLAESASDSAVAKAHLLRVLELRPVDLYASYHLRRLEAHSGNSPQSSSYDVSLQRFQARSLIPIHSGLFEAEIPIALNLLDDGTWNRGTFLSVLGHLIWQRPNSAAVWQLAQGYRVRNPEDGEGVFLLAELLERRGEQESAFEQYQSALRLHPLPSAALLRVALLCEKLPGCGPEAAALWYAEHLRSAPDDFLASARLESLCREHGSRLGEACTRSYQGSDADQPLAVRTRVYERQGLIVHYATGAHMLSDAALVRQLLGVATGETAIGDSLLINGGFEEGTSGWRVLDHTGGAFASGAFSAGIDALAPFSGRGSARIDGFWLAFEQEKAPGRFGLMAQDESRRATARIGLPPGDCLLVSLAYRTEGPKVAATVHLAREGVEVSLVPSNGLWRRARLLVCNSGADEAQMEPLVRLRSAGRLWFDDVEMRLVSRW